MNINKIKINYKLIMVLLLVFVMPNSLLAGGHSQKKVDKKNLMEVYRSKLIDNQGKKIGEVRITQALRGVLIYIKAEGLAAGPHGIHIHNVGDCSDIKAFKKSGGHIHQEGKKEIHGYFSEGAQHLADLPNIYFSESERAEVEYYVAKVSLKDKNLFPLLDKDGSAIVIHKSPDDYKTQPIGNAGPRLACSEIKI